MHYEKEGENLQIFENSLEKPNFDLIIFSNLLIYPKEKSGYYLIPFIHDYNLE
jgi:hypothetical protein